MSLFFNIYNKDTESNIINKCVNTLNNGGTVIYNTDSVYAIGVSLLSVKGVEKLHEIKKVKKGNHNFSLICSDISMASKFTSQLSKTQYKIMNKNLPGPFTFILETNVKLPRKLSIKRKTIGIRIPNNNIPRMLADYLGCPLLTTSLKHEDFEEYNNYLTDPEVIHSLWKNKVDIFLNSGMGNNYGSTVVELINENPKIIRQGIGELIL